MAKRLKLDWTESETASVAAIEDPHIVVADVFPVMRGGVWDSWSETPRYAIGFRDMESEAALRRAGVQATVIVAQDCETGEERVQITYRKPRTEDN